MTTIPLNKLKFGDDYPGGSINARKSGKEEGLIELGATILDKGLIHALVIKTAGGKPYVMDGNRRLAAMRRLVGEKKLDKDWPVKVEEMDPGVDPLEASLTANIMQLPMHEVDQYEAFAKLADAGKSIPDIASSFGTSDLIVRRRLALGTLSPKLRQAWRENRLTAEAAQAFTVSQDHDFQDSVFAALAKGGSLYRDTIIRNLTRSDQALAGDIKFVGRDAYLAAGGRMVDDLFKDEAHILDGDILKRLEREKIEAVCQRLVAEGWAWAALASDLSHDRYQWPRVEVTVVYTEDELFRIEEIKPLVESPAAGDADSFRQQEAARQEMTKLKAQAWQRSLTAEHKAASGCVLRVGYEGNLFIDYGIMRPGDQIAGAAAYDERGSEDAPIAPSAGPEISGALAQTLSEQLTLAAAKALANDPDVALRVVVATLQATYRSPARISLQGFPGIRSANGGSLTLRETGRQPTFAEALAATERASRPYLLVELATLIAPGLDLTEAARLDSSRAVDGRAELLDALDPESYLAAAREAFDASAYFDHAPAAVSIEAVAEMGGAKPTGKKGVIALAAATMAQQLGWLPPMMRSTHYVSPKLDVAPPAITRKGRGRKASAPEVGAP